MSRPLSAVVCIFLLLLFILPAPLANAQQVGVCRHSGRPRIGLALSGGGAKGVAHIGVIARLLELGVPIDYISGTSMGSIIGGLYAAGYSTEQLTNLMTEVDWTDSFLSKPNRRLLRFDQKREYERYVTELGIKAVGIEVPRGVIVGYKLTALLTRLCLPVADIEDFDQLPVPFRCVATDILNGDKVVLKSGNLAHSMRASMSIPSVFPPFDLDGRLLVDGGVVENLPVETVRDMGADLVIAVNVSSPLMKREELKNFVDILDQTVSLQIVKSTNRQLKMADVVITPKVLDFGTFDFDKSDELIRLGRESVDAELNNLMALLQAANVNPGEPPPCRPDISVDEIVIQEVIWDAPKHYIRQLKRLVPFKPGQKIKPKVLDQAVQKVYGLGSFETVKYQVHHTDEGRSVVKFLVKEKQGAVLTRLGLSVNLSNERDSMNRFNLNFKFPNLPTSGSSAELELTAGQKLGARLGLQMNDYWLYDYYLRPSVYIDSILHNVYLDKGLRAKYEADTLGASIDTGAYLGTWGELGVGLIAEKSRITPKITTLDLRKQESDLIGWRASLGIDTLDQRPFPKNGFRSTFVFTNMNEDLGSDVDYMRLVCDGQAAATFYDKHTLEANYTYATTLGTNPPLSKSLFLGGFPGMLGYTPEEFMGHELARFQAKYRYRLMERIYVELTGNTGAVWDSLQEQYNTVTDDRRWFVGGGIGLSMDTLIGPLNLAFGLGERERYNFYLHYGYFFE